MHELYYYKDYLINDILCAAENIPTIKDVEGMVPLSSVKNVFKHNCRNG